MRYRKSNRFGVSELIDQSEFLRMEERSTGKDTQKSYKFWPLAT